MADYHPLISRAVANLGPSTPEQRRDLYDRASAALIGQLRNSDPPIAEADIVREQMALDDAIRRIETEVAGGMPVGGFSAAPPPVIEPATPADVEDLSLGRDERPPVAAAPPRVQMAMDREPAAAPPSDAGADAETVADAARGASVQEAAIQDATADRWRDAGALRPRPPAPRLDRGERRWVRAAIIGVAIAVVVGLTATAAIMLKHQPSEFLPQAPVAPVAADAEGKFQDRLAGDAPPQSPQTQSAAPAPTPGTQAQAPASPQQQATVPPQPAIGVLQRAILVEEPAEGSQDPKETQGRVRWRLDSVSAGPGEPLDVAVRAEVDLSGAGLKADIVLRRNRDAALPASHTVEVKFSPTTATAIAVRDMLAPEMRDDATQRGTPLAGIPVPVTDNLFLVGLSNLGSDIQRNIELLRGRNWLMLTLRFANGRRALLLIEKGPTGGRTIADALQAWQQG